jgi:electron transfer flavoprotein alpha subunit
MSKDIWVHIEHIEGKIANVSLELLSEAHRLQAQRPTPGKVVAVLIGSQVEPLIQTLEEYGAEQIYVADKENLELYQPQYYANIYEKLIKEKDPDILLVGSTAIGSQLAPTIALKVKTGVAAHSIELRMSEKDQLVSVVPAFGGKVLGDILCPNHRPQMASIKAGILDKPEKKQVKAEVLNVDLSFLDEVKTDLIPLNIKREEPKGVPLEEAEIVICGGWGIGDQETWELLNKIAEKLGGAVASTRPPVDEGWAPGEHIMIGTSGKSVRPKVYLGFGISGATHHVCGMKDAGVIININKDENAEIFNVSDFGAVGDVKKILPLLEDALQS